MSASAPRRITCTDCGMTVALYATGRIYHHGPKAARCASSGQLAGTIFTASITGAEITSDIAGVFAWIMAHVWDANLDAVYADLCQLDRMFEARERAMYLGGTLTVTRH